MPFSAFLYLGDSMADDGVPEPSLGVGRDVAESGLGLLATAKAPLSPTRAASSQAKTFHKGLSSSSKGSKTKKAPKASSNSKHSNTSSQHSEKEAQAPLQPSPLPPLQLDLNQGPFSLMLPINTSGLWGTIGPHFQGRSVEATFTPTAAGLRPEEHLAPLPALYAPAAIPAMPSGYQDLIVEAIKQGIGAGLKERASGPQAEAPRVTSQAGGAPAPAALSQLPEPDCSPSLASEEGKIRESDLLDEERPVTDKPSYTGLFPSNLFIPLLLQGKGGF